MEHIEIWKTRKAEEEEQRQAERKVEDAKEERVTQKFRDILAKHGITKMYTNGYVYEFQYKGLVYHFVNQDTRLCCTIHRPFVSKDDEACFTDMQYRMVAGEAPGLVMEYGYRSFIIEGSPVRAFRKLLLA